MITLDTDDVDLLNPMVLDFLKIIQNDFLAKLIKLKDKEIKSKYFSNFSNMTSKNKK